MSKKWTENETSSLIELYSEYFKSLEKLQRKKPIYQIMSDKLRVMGFFRNSNQIAKKIANLRSDYKKHNPGNTGGETPTWVHYSALHKILHERPSLNAVVAETSEIGLDEVQEEIPVRVEENENFEEDPLADVSGGSPDTGPQRKKARVTNEAVRLCSETLDFMNGEAVKREKEREEAKVMNTSLLEILGRIATSAEVMAKNSTPTVFPYTVVNEDLNDGFQ